MTESFPDPLQFEDAGMVRGSRSFRLLHRFRYFGTSRVIVHRGFVTDGASIPRIFWNIMAPTGSYFSAAIIHDFLYSGFNEDVSRAKSDKIFREAMKSIGVPLVTREIIYRAVRLFGWMFFKGYRP
jgi:hypothetical protein